MPIARSGEADIHYEVLGNAGSPVLLSSGLGGSARFWTPQIDALTVRHRVIVYDHRGTGRSSREYSGGESVDRMSEDMLAVMQAAGFASAHVVGHAIGGITGLNLARQTPDRIRSLVLVNAWARADAHLRRCFAVRKEILRASGPRAYVQAQPLFLYPPDWNAAHDHALREEAELQVSQFPSPQLLVDRIDAFSGFDAVDTLGTLATPTLVVASRDDSLVPVGRSREIANAIPGARLVEVDYGAHACTVVAPDDFNRVLLGFLDEIDRRT